MYFLEYEHFYTTCCELVFFGEFNEQSLVILWVSWFKNESFWKIFTCNIERIASKKSAGPMKYECSFRKGLNQLWRLYKNRLTQPFYLLSKKFDLKYSNFIRLRFFSQSWFKTSKNIENCRTTFVKWRKLYFVTKTFLTYYEKKNVLVIKKNFWN